MEKTPIPQKSNSFSSSSTNNEKLRHRNLSLNAIQFLEKSKDQDHDDEKPEKIDEGEEEERGEAEGNENADANEDDHEEADAAISEETLRSLIEDVDQFLAILVSLREREGQISDSAVEDGDDYELLPEIPESTIDKFVALVEEEISKYQLGEEKLSAEHHDINEPSLLDAINRISKLTNMLSSFASNPTYFNMMNVTSTVLHHAMTFFEEEFYSLLEESSKSSKDQGGGSSSGGGKTKRPPSFRGGGSHDHDRSVLSPSSADSSSPFDSYPCAETLVMLRAVANAMISSRYDTECRQVFAFARRNAFKSTLSSLGFEKIAIDDVQRMAWDALEAEIAKWTKSFKIAIAESLSLERDLCLSVFESHHPIAADIFYRLACNTIHNLLNFPEAVAMTKRSTEKLFKVLDMYEALKDMIPKIDHLFPPCQGNKGGGEGQGKSEVEEDEEENLPEEGGDCGGGKAELKSEISAVKSRLGEAAVAIFCELENSIKSDTGKNAVPGGAVHPLTRYVMNYLKYACEYIDTLEQIFKDHRKFDESSYDEESSSSNNSNKNNNNGDHTPFESQLIQLMDLLQSSLDSKARLYKEHALNNIFLMNNGRYIVQKIKGSPEINKLLGNNWCRKRSSDLRQYHKNYQRETWSKVLACFKDDGLTVKGSVSKPVLKERFKSFNALFDEVHKVQCTWVVSDEQLQSELRVSISAVVVPAYRSFLGRFQQVLDPGRQTEKYIKYAPEDLETAIDELFDGNPSSIVRRRT